MNRNSALWQGLGIVVFGIFFLMLTSVLFYLGKVTIGRLPIFYGLSVFLLAIGAVLLVLSRKMPQPLPPKKRQQKTPVKCGFN